MLGGDCVLHWHDLRVVIRARYHEGINGQPNLAYYSCDWLFRFL